MLLDNIASRAYIELVSLSCDALMLCDMVFQGQLYSCICNHLMQDNLFLYDIVCFFVCFFLFLPNGGIICSNQVEIFGLIRYDVIYIFFFVCLFVFVSKNGFSSRLDCNSAFNTIPVSDILPG